MRIEVLLVTVYGSSASPSRLLKEIPFVRNSKYIPGLPVRFSVFSGLGGFVVMIVPDSKFHLPNTLALTASAGFSVGALSFLQLLMVSADAAISRSNVNFFIGFDVKGLQIVYLFTFICWFCHGKNSDAVYRQ